MKYRKHFVPLESDPLIFTQLAHALGLKSVFEFQDVIALEEQPAIAAILIYHTSDDYDAQLERNRKCGHARMETGNDGIVWFEQTINNACALYGILHAILNGPRPNLLRPDSFAESLRHMSPQDQINELENSSAVKDNYELAAASGGSDLPDPDSDVDYHYVTFVAWQGHLVELDGDRGGPVDRGSLERQDEGALGPTFLKAIEPYLDEQCHVMKLAEVPS